MQGKIELHGAKQMLVSDTGIRQIESNNYIPGDCVLMFANGTSELVLREAQSVVGVTKAVVNNISELYIASLGPTCKFSPKININSVVGDRFLLWLEENGEIVVKQHYGPSAKDDAACLIDHYMLEEQRRPPYWVMGGNLYSVKDVVNHEDLDTFTIDPETSVDFDDAISVDVANNTIYVHIVDIADIHQNNTHLADRCFTLYLANEHTEHLLSTEDASDTLSLVQGKSRPVITVKAVLTSEGTVSTYEIYRSTIVVKRRWDYGQVAAALEDGSAPQAIVYLDNLSKQRSSNVNYHISLPSVRLDIDKLTGDVRHLVSENTNDSAHTLVATAMILANLIVSKHLSDLGVKMPNRFHDSLRGLNPTADFVSTGNKEVDSFILVKKYARAFYSIDMKGHFGLGIKDYVHFTSPMRRYADVVVHNLLAGCQYLMLDEEVDWINRRATKVRAIQSLYTLWKVIRHLRTLPVGPHEIWLTGVSPAGVMWFMPSLSLNGFMHVSTLVPTQYWSFEDDRLVGKTTGAVLAVGTKLNAFCKKIDDVTSTVSLYLQT